MPYTPKEPRPLPDPVPVLRVKHVIEGEQEEGIDSSDASQEDKYLVSVLLNVSMTDAVLMDYEEGVLAANEVARQKNDVRMVNGDELERDEVYGVQVKATPVCWTEDEDTGARTVQLKHPLTDKDGNTHESVTLRRFKIGDQPSSKLVGTRSAVKTVSNLSGLPPSLVSQMYLGDFTAAEYAISDFLLLVQSRL